MNYSGNDIINIGTGSDVTIRELAETIAGVVGYEGELRWDTTRPEGMPRKLLDVSRLNSLGWKSGVSLGEGIERTYEWFLRHAPA
jgi:GDP-L-fucose synthase